MQSKTARACLYGIGLLAMVASAVHPVLAGETRTVPEIDGGSISAGLGLLAAGVLVLRARWRG